MGKLNLAQLKNPILKPPNISITMNNPNISRWLNSLGDDTKHSYERRLHDFIEWREQNPTTTTIMAIENFIEYLHDEGMMVSTLRSILSPLKSFLEYTEKLNFYKENPLFQRVLDQWEKKEKTKQSAVSTIC